MKANAEKCHFLCNSNQKAHLTDKNEEMKNNLRVKLFSVKSNSRLTFNTHVNCLGKKERQKLNTWARTTPYLDFDKERLLLNAFFSFTI